MTLWFDDKEEHEVYISHTKVTLPYNEKEYEKYGFLTKEKLKKQKQ